MCPTSPTNSLPDVGVLIPAAGRGERFGGEPKQFRPIAGVPMLLRSLRPFAKHPRVNEIIVALPPEWAAAPPHWLGSVAGHRLRLVAGGATRGDSVRAALGALSEDCRIVLIHDAARPLVSAETVEAVISVACETGAVPAVPVTDTLKRVQHDSDAIVATVDRSGLWRAHTPQGFPRDMLQRAYRAVGPERWSTFTDEASLVEAAGFPVRLVPDSCYNLKVTTAQDLMIAELLAEA